MSVKRSELSALYFLSVMDEKITNSVFQEIKLTNGLENSTQNIIKIERKATAEDIGLNPNLFVGTLLQNITIKVLFLFTFIFFFLN